MKIIYLILALIVSVLITYYFLRHENREPLEAVLLGTLLGLLWPMILLIGLIVLIDDEEKTNEDPN